MIDTLRQTICDYSDSLAGQATNLLPFSINAKAPHINRIRGRVLPLPARAAGVFAPDTISWLLSCATETSVNQEIIFALPMLGITNRPLPGYKKGGFNLFKTIATVIALPQTKNLDQCTIEFSSRFPMTVKDFNDELARQICIAGGTIKKSGKLAFYADGVSNAALASDHEALRLCALKTMPVINIDWLDTDNNWNVRWNPCSHLKPVRKKLECKLTRFLDQIIEQICASRCNVLINGTGSFFDSTYLSYRHRHNLPALNINKSAALTDH